MATLQEEHLKELRHTYISYSMNSKVVFLTYPGILTDDLKQLYINIKMVMLRLINHQTFRNYMLKILMMNT